MFTLVVPTAPNLLKVLLLLAALYGFGEYGIGGLRDSLQGRQVRVLTVEDVQRGGLTGARYVRLTGLSDGTYFYLRSRGGEGDTVIEYPLLSTRDYAGAGESAGPTQPPLVSVVVSDRTLATRCADVQQDCVKAGPHTVEGLIRSGPGALPLDTGELLRKDGRYTLSPDVVLLLAGHKADPLWVPLLILVGLGLVVFLLAVSFVPGVRLW